MSEGVRRDTPNPNRPRLPEELERTFEPVDEKSRAAYTLIEQAVEALDEAVGDGAVVGELDVTESLVHHLQGPR